MSPNCDDVAKLCAQVTSNPNKGRSAAPTATI
jgi:hypothetical protein